MTDVATITARIVAIAEDMTGVTAGDVYPADMNSALPFCFVEEGAATFAKTDSNNLRITQTFSLLLYVQAFEEEKTGEADAAYQACRPYLTSVPEYFWNRTRLQRNDQGATSVLSANMPGHDGIQSADRNNYLYMGVAYTLTVVYDSYIDEI